ncbi:MAG: hypothetical protein IIA72_19085 [Proteobacteria bacterium]|nr:hypothetical protein [Pseudomonadota bacterium]
MLNNRGTLVAILSAIFVLFTSSLLAEENGPASPVPPVDISIGVLESEGGNSAIRYIAEFLNEPAPYFAASCDPSKKPGQKLGKSCDGIESGWLLYIAPDVDLDGGGEDSFDSVVLKISGHFMTFDLQEIQARDDQLNLIPDESIIGLDLKKPFHVFPISAGIETTREMDFVNALVEVGYRPYVLQGPFQIGRNLKFGIFLQGGYKFSVDDDPAAAAKREGGARDESEEKTDDMLARLKIDLSGKIDLGDLGINFGDLGIGTGTGQSVTLIPKVTGWYDAANSEFYHSVELALRFGLGDDKFFDLKYQNGSGAPNFNEGSQFGASLTVRF